MVGESPFVTGQVPLQSIQCNRQWSLHPWLAEQCPSDLIDAFRRCGVLHPPVVQLKATGGYQLLCGYYRLIHYRSSLDPHHGIPCIILPPSTPSENLLRLVLEDQLLSGPLSLMEKARFIQLCKHHLNAQEHSEILKLYGAALQLPLQADFADRLCTLLNEPAEIVKAIHSGEIHEKSVLELLKGIFSATERTSCYEMLRTLKAGANKQKKLLGMLMDVSKRTRQTIDAILQGPGYRNVLKHPEMNGPQKTHHLLEKLEAELRPNYLKAEREFRHQVDAMHLPAEYALDHSPYFEKDEITLTIRFPSMDSCRQFLDDQQRLVSSRSD